MGTSSIVYVCRDEDTDATLFHIVDKIEKWDIRMNMDGSFNSIARAGCIGRQQAEDFNDIEIIAKGWVQSCYFDDDGYTLTNGEFTMILWNTENYYSRR